MSPSPLQVVIIDDEAPARRDLRTQLGAHPGVTIMGEAALFDDARTVLRQASYNLVFLDVQLIGGVGFDLVPDVRPDARIVFVTAHDRFALRAFEVNALDYLLKPLRAARLAQSLERARAPALASAPAAAPRLASDDVVLVKTGPGAARFIRVAELVAITSADNYSIAMLANGERLFIRQTLAAWEARLPGSHFLRVHRQHIVNLQRVAGYQHETDEITFLRLHAVAEPIRARREHWPLITARLAALGVSF
jgi:two-component system LytT family response regulator